ncbi:MAG: hypothetical protein P8X86_16880 [Desulfofustis sp.]|jgi:hypothetical protein
MFSVRRLRYLAVILGCLVIAALFKGSAAQACTICVPYPKRTLADRLLQYNEIIFAREVENSPYLFEQAELIRGTGISAPVKIFCDSSTRRKLQFIPDSVVVLARTSGADKWRMITFADGAYQPFIRAIVEQGGDWADSQGKRARLHYFSKLLTSKHRLIQEQAYLEVGRAPYATIKILAPEIPADQIYGFLENFRFIEWHSLYILLLGQSRHPDDRAYIRKQVESAVRFGTTTNLAAWLTAFIEAHPETGIAEIETWYFSRLGRSNEELDQVMNSLSVLGSQQAGADLPLFPLRNRIVKSYATLLENHPMMAGRVAKDLSMWQVRAHVERLSEIRQEHTLVEPSEIYLLDYYLSMAPSFARFDPAGVR